MNRLVVRWTPSFGGSDWTQQESGTLENLNRIWGSGYGDVYVLGENNTILQFNGSSWSEAEFESTAELRDICGVGPR